MFEYMCRILNLFHGMLEGGTEVVCQDKIPNTHIFYLILFIVSSIYSNIVFNPSSELNWEKYS